MKKYFVYIASALLGLAAIVSCNKETAFPENPAEPAVAPEDGLVTINFRADVENPVTRVSAADEGTSITYTWQAGDEIKVLYDGGSTTATATISDGAATFSPSVPDGTTTLLMVYPSSLEASIVGGRLKIDMPAVQKDVLPAVFVARCSASDASVTFRHPVSWYKIVVDGDGTDVTRLILSSAGDNALSASAIALDFNGSGIPSVYSRDNVASEVTLDFSGAGTYYLPIMPDVAKDASDLTFQFYRGEAKTEKAGAYRHAKVLADERGSLVNWGSLPAKATNRYVSTSGSSSNNGATPEAPWNFGKFQSFIENTAKNGNSTRTEDALSLYDGVNIRFAGGSYTISSKVTPYNTGTFSSGIKLNIIGAEDGTTVFTGDNKVFHFDIYKVVNDSYIFKNITFKNGYNSSNHGGAFRIGSRKHSVSFENCSFEGNHVESSKYGGAFHIANANTVSFKDCSFIGNYANNGGVFNLVDNAIVSCVGCTFGDGTDEGANYATNGGGVLISSNSEAHSFTECLFDNNKANGNWGSCLYLYGVKGKLKIDRCLFKNNTAASRGVIGANVTPASVDNAHLIYINASSFYGNTVTAADGYGSVIQGNQGTTACLHNVTSTNNYNSNASLSNNNWTLNLDGSWLIVNSTIVDKGRQHILRANLTGSPSVALCNNIIVQYEGIQNYPIWIRNNGTITDNGHNLRGDTSAGNITSATDKFSVTKEMLAGSWNELWNSSSKYGVYEWSGSIADFTPATQAEVENTITGYSHSAADVSNVGSDFYNWLDEIGALGKDARGVTRGTPWWPGAYQN